MHSDQDQDDQNHLEHLDALDETGFWGRRGAGCLVMAMDTGRLLVPHRSEHVLEPHTWGTWGGAIDTGENPQDAVMREVSEEAGYQGRCQAHPMAVFSHESGFRYFNFIVTVEREFEPELNWETQASAWIDPLELIEGRSIASPMHPGLRYLLDNSAQEILALAGVSVDAQAAAEPSPPWRDQTLAANGRCVAENFRDWFGSSQALDEVGDPLVAYHGTSSDFETFTPSRGGEFGPGIYFTSSINEANGYVATNAARGNSGHNVVPVYLRIENPFVVREFASEFWDAFSPAELKRSDEQAIEAARAAGHDGIVFERAVQRWVDGQGAVDTGERQKHFVVFDASQVKSAIGNSGLYLKDSNSLSDFREDRLLRSAQQARAEAAEASSAEDFIPKRRQP